MESPISDQVVKQVFDLFLAGKTKAEIKAELNITDMQWISVNRRFTQLGLIHQSGAKTKLQQIQEIERELFEALEQREKLLNTTIIDRRIEKLTSRYASFVL